MTITEFFAKHSSGDLQKHSAILFIGKNYSPLFFDRALVFLQASSSDQQIKKINIDLDISQISLNVATTFLGQTCIYWFGDLSLISSKKKRIDLITMFQRYQGPHVLIGFITSEEAPLQKSSCLEVSIENSYGYDQIKRLSLLHDGQKPEIAAMFFAKLFRINKEYGLDQICLLQDYAGLLGKNMDMFFDNWAEKLVASDISLFYLSQLFFEKKAEEFFLTWSVIRTDYSDQFWTTYFSEQLFKAYFYTFWQGKVPIDQKQLTFGLPFSFLKQDWKLYSTFELEAAHQKMYEIDIALKSGGSSYRLDSFFALFFAGDFS